MDMGLAIHKPYEQVYDYGPEEIGSTEGSPQ